MLHLRLFWLLSLVLVALASQTPLLLHASNDTITPALFLELEELARVVDIAYCVSLTGLGIEKPFRCLSRCSDFPAFELVRTWNTGPLLSDSCGYVALDHGQARIIVAFRGTYSIANTVVDLSTVPQEYVPYPGTDNDTEVHTYVSPPPKCANCTVHAGFHRSWLNTRDEILNDIQTQVFMYPDYQLHLVGHSLGGAVAALAGLDFLGRGWEPVVTTFGEPRIGNAATAKFLDERFRLPTNTTSSGEHKSSLRYRRVTHVDDPVPLLPLTEWGFVPHAGELFISKSSLPPSPEDILLCAGDTDPACLGAQDSSLRSSPSSLHRAATDPLHHRPRRDLLASVQTELDDIRVEPWGIPARYKLWQLFFAHRDYFWRLGLCVPGGDPLGGGGKGKYGHDLPPGLEDERAAMKQEIELEKQERATDREWKDAL